MKDKMIDLYSRKCKAKKVNSNDDFRTYAYKPGIAEDASKRNTKGDFLKVLNANPKHSLMGSAQDGGSTFEARITDDVIISGPDKCFIEPLEQYVLYEYFKGDERSFDTKKEFILSYEETTKKYEELVKILQSKEHELTNLNEAYDQLDNAQDKAIRQIADQYVKLLEEIKSSLKKFQAPFLQVNVKVPVKTSSPNNPVLTATVVVPPTQDIYKVLTQDFILLKGQGQYMLMHKVHHAGKDPASPTGSWKADIANSKEPKFQFHNTDFVKKFGYNQSSMSAPKVVRIFGSQILDYDDPNFDRSKLP